MNYRDKMPEGATEPKKTRRVLNWDQLPKYKKGFDTFHVSEANGTRQIAARCHDSQVLRGLIDGPIYAASLCRIGENISNLRHDHGLNIRTEVYQKDGREFGVFRLADKVRYERGVTQ